MWNHKLSLFFDVSLHLSSASTLYSRRCQYSPYIPDVGSRVSNFKAEFGMPIKYQVYLICSSNFTCSILQLYSTRTHLISQKAREKRLRFQAAFGVALKWQVNRNHFCRFYCSMLQLYSTSPTPLYQGTGRASHVIEESEMPMKGQVYRMCSFYMLATVKWQRPPYARRQG